MFSLDDINEDKLFQYHQTYKEYVKLIKNAYVFMLDKGEFEKAQGLKELLEQLISDGEFYIENNKIDVT